MTLEEFKVGDKVVDRNCGTDPLGPEYWTVAYIGRQTVVLQPSYEGFGEQTAPRTARGFRLYQPKLTYNDLKATLDELKMIGDDLVASIRNAAWDQELSGPTHHMRSAADRWEEANV